MEAAAGFVAPSCRKTRAWSLLVVVVSAVELVIAKSHPEWTGAMEIEAWG